MKRDGTFSSSNAWKLMTNDKPGTGFGAPALKYIKQVGYEVKLSRPINKEFNSRPTDWGNVCEPFVFERIDISYTNVSKQRIVHPTIRNWSGAPDFTKPLVVADCKCPYSLEVFCDKMKALKNIETFKKEFPEDYWQLISNACLLEANGHPVSYMEAVNFVPYKEDLDKIKMMANGNPDFYWLQFADDDQLPYLLKGGEYTDLNVHRFAIPEDDKQELTERILKAVKKLYEGNDITALLRDSIELHNTVTT
jgi:hypothetical protein